MKQNNYYSYNTNGLTEGCKLCIKGRKSVLFITGLCPRKCFYCPVSEHKMYRDLQYINERPCSTIEEVIDEVKMAQSQGVGITGGDPLAVIKRTCAYIRALKKEFGPSFHIHLYTSLNLINEKVLNALYTAGLDEIRFHPELTNTELWERIKLARNFDWKIGIEIPAIPRFGDRIKALLELAHPYIDFLVMNQLEYSEMNAAEYKKRQLLCASSVSYAIKGSKEMSLRLVVYFKKQYPKLTVHFCTAKLKDAVQLTNRIKLRSKNAAQPFDVVDKDGLLIRGVIEKDKGQVQYVTSLKKKYNIPDQLFAIDKTRNQILVAAWVLREIREDIPYTCKIVTEYPTWDRLVVEEEEI